MQDDLDEDFARALQIDEMLDGRTHPWQNRPRCSGCKGSFGPQFLAAHQAACVLFQRNQKSYLALKVKLDRHCEQMSVQRRQRRGRIGA